MARQLWSSGKVSDPGRGVVGEEIELALPMPKYEQIAERARKLWEEKGCPVGRDEEIWLEAERQLREQMRGS